MKVLCVAVVAAVALMVKGDEGSLRETVVAEALESEDATGKCWYRCPQYSFQWTRSPCPFNFDHCKCEKGYYKKGGKCVSQCHFECPKNSFQKTRGVCPKSFHDCECKKRFERNNRKERCERKYVPKPTYEPTYEPVKQPEYVPTYQPGYKVPAPPVYGDYEIPEHDFKAGLICVLVPAPGYNVSGTLKLVPQKAKGIVITGEISNLEPGTRSWHIHESGSQENGCASMRGHYNPFGVNHGAPVNDLKNRHVGDLGNFHVDKNGVAHLAHFDKFITAKSVVGRGIVIHGGEDDLGQGGNDASLAAGNSGPRVACCTIAIP